MRTVPLCPPQSDSEPGQGTCFSFTVRLETGEARQSEAEAHWEDLRGIRALAVDDNASSREVLKSMLSSFHFDVSTASSGEEAPRILSQAIIKKPLSRFIRLRD